MYAYKGNPGVKHNYLNNKDILKEIHKSKTTYCTFLDKADAQYDIIVYDISEIKPESIAIAKENRADRIAKEAHELANKDVTVAKNKRKFDEFAIDPTTIPVTDLVFRVMTWEHIPVAPPKKKKGEVIAEEEEDSLFSEYDDPNDEVGVTAPTPIKYVKLNFPPFFHYKFNDAGQLTVVGKSHWKGDINSGEYCREHGQMTPKLAHMFIKLCERYATRSNWRGYTYNDEMRSQALLQLSQIGLQFDEAKSQNPFAYYTAAITNSFTRVLNIEKRNQNIRDDILEMNNYTPSYTRQGLTGWGGGGQGHGADE